MKKRSGYPKKGCSLSEQIESIQSHRMAEEQVIDLDMFRELKKNRKKPVVLVVEDDEIVRNGLKRILEAEGFHVILAEDAMAFSRVLDHQDFDVILMDIKLPWVDGIELCQIVKSHKSFQSVPVVLMSGEASPEDVELGVAAGCDDVLIKPFDASELISMIQEKISAVSV